MGFVDRYFGWRKRQAVARYERCQRFPFRAAREQPKHQSAHGAETNRSRSIPASREGVEAGSLMGPVIPRGFAGP